MTKIAMNEMEALIFFCHGFTVLPYKKKPNGHIIRIHRQCLINVLNETLRSNYALFPTKRLTRLQDANCDKFRYSPKMNM